jgi:hypothetical protein
MAHAQILVGAREKFPLQNFQTGSATNPASCSKGTQTLSPGHNLAIHLPYSVPPTSLQASTEQSHNEFIFSFKDSKRQLHTVTYNSRYTLKTENQFNQHA